MNAPLVKLGDICEVRAGANQRAVEDPNGTFPIYGSGGKIGYANAWRCPANTVLVGRKGTLNNPMLIPEPLWNIDTAFGLIASEKVLPAFLHRFCQSVDFEKLVPDSGRPSTTATSIRNLEIPLPPSLAEQERIVAHLERTLGAIDAMEAKFREMAETADCHFRATLAEAFAALSSAPSAKLGEVCETTSGGTPLKSHKEYYEGGAIPWLRSGEVCKKDIEAAECFITPAGMENSSAKLFPVNTVLVAMYGATAGQVGILRFPATTNQAICGILPSTRFVPEFLYYALLQQKAALVRRAVGGAQPNISQEKIREVVLPLPPLVEQERVVARLERAEGVSRRMVALAQEGVAQCGVYRRAVLAEAFGGGGDE